MRSDTTETPGQPDFFTNRKFIGRGGGGVGAQPHTPRGGSPGARRLPGARGDATRLRPRAVSRGRRARRPGPYLHGQEGACFCWVWWQMGTPPPPEEPPPEEPPPQPEPPPPLEEPPPPEEPPPQLGWGRHEVWMLCWEPPPE